MSQKKPSIAPTGIEIEKVIGHEGVEFILQLHLLELKWYQRLVQRRTASLQLHLLELKSELGEIKFELSETFNCTYWN